MPPCLIKPPPSSIRRTLPLLFHVGWWSPGKSPPNHGDFWLRAWPTVGYERAGIGTLIKYTFIGLKHH